MKKTFLFYFTLLLIYVLLVFEAYGKSGCCSHHGGVAGCNSSSGYYQCSDGTDSPSCTCESSSDLNDTTSTSTEIKIYKWVDKKGITHFSDTP